MKCKCDKCEHMQYDLDTFIETGFGDYFCDKGHWKGDDSDIFYKGIYSPVWDKCKDFEEVKSNENG